MKNFNFLDNNFPKIRRVGTDVVQSVKGLSADFWSLRFDQIYYREQIFLQIILPCYVLFCYFLRVRRKYIQKHISTFTLTIN